jgi:hypothetical protein
MFPVDAGQDPETLRRHTLKIAAGLRAQAATQRATAPAAIIVTLESTFMWSCEDDARHLEVRIGNVEAEAGRRQVFGAVAKADTDLGALIRRSLDSVGGTDGTTLTAFTDGCPGLRRILLDAGVVELPILDWFHLAMRLQHLTQTAGSLSSDDPERAAAKAMIGDLYGSHRITLGADEAYGTTDFVAEMPRLGVTPHVTQNDKGRRSAIDGRTTRHAGYAVSQRIRKRIVEALGWMKTVGGQRKTRYRGTARVGWMFTLSAAACNLVRMPKLLGVAA